MTDKDESQISSFNVSVHSSEKSGTSEAFSKKDRLSPWVVLICFDGGFSSEKPERITAASFSQFLEE
ncbi:MAG: hypothetical protein N2053_12950, partial [Chitinispirillaceae bacterium]|nr:hypothetical protein [Chitinispirillaceae bacterium]